MSNGKIRLKKIEDSGINWYYHRRSKTLFTNELLSPIKILRVPTEKIKDVINFCNMLVEKYSYYPYLVSIPQMNELNF
jgi:hypothetical protein